jgi:tripartite-type tricarboxylate transporter receptor subunit TctC
MAKNVMSIGMSQMTITPFVHKQMPYDPIKDFEGVAVIGTSPLVLVVPAGTGVNKLADLEKVAASQAGGMNFGSPGKGSPAHLLTTALAESMNWPATHVPFVGEAAGLTALMGQQIQAMTLVIGTAAAQVKAGKLIPLAVFAAERSSLMPDVPTISEAGGPKALARPAWIAIVAKKGTPPDVLAKLNEATNKCRNDSAYVTRMNTMNVTLTTSKPSDVALWAERDIAVWKPLIDKLGLASE